MARHLFIYRLNLSRPTCASLCWLSASPGHTRAWWASWMSMDEPSITWQAESSMAAAAWGSKVLAATPLADWANILRAWAVSLAATPVANTQSWDYSAWIIQPCEKESTVNPLWILFTYQDLVLSRSRNEVNITSDEWHMSIFVTISTPLQLPQELRG